MNKLTIDFETRSALDPEACGAAAYAEPSIDRGHLPRAEKTRSGTLDLVLSGFQITRMPRLGSAPEHRR